MGKCCIRAALLALMPTLCRFLANGTMTVPLMAVVSLNLSMATHLLAYAQAVARWAFQAPYTIAAPRQTHRLLEECMWVKLHLGGVDYETDMAE